MSISLSFNGQSYIIPTPGETGWGSNLDSFFVAIPAGCLQKVGGSFTLAAETDFGGAFGLKSLYLKSKAINPAAAGMLRLANSDNISWRNTLNTLDLPLAINGLDQLTFNGVVVASGGPGVPADATHNGYLLATDWVIFNGKQNAITILPVANGGTGVSTFTPYAVVCAGTTPTGVIQGVTGLGTLGQVLTSSGPAALPTWTTVGGGGGSGTVNSGTQYELAYYATTGTAVSGNLNIKTNALGQLLLSTQAFQVPSLAFANATGVGIGNSYDPAWLSFSTANLLRWSINPNGALWPSNNSVLYISDGTYQAPSLSWSGYPTMGLYRWSANAIGFTVDNTGNSVARMGYYGGSNWQFRVPEGVETDPSFSFMARSSSGMYAKDVSGAATVVLAASANDSFWASRFFIRSLPPHYFANGTAAAPSITFWDSTTTGLYRPGADTLGITTTGVLRFQVNPTGLVTQPTQSSFLVLNGTGATDITGNGNLHSVNWLTEIYDLHNDFVPNIFTAPITGKYLLSVSIGLLDILATHTTVQLQLVTNYRTYVVNRDEALAASKLSLSITVIADMAAGHTASVKVVATGGPTDSIDLAADATMNYFSGSLIN